MTLRRSSCSACCQTATKSSLTPGRHCAALKQCRKLQGGLNTHLWWGQAFTQVMHKVQSLLSVSWAGWLCRGQPAVSSPSGDSAGPPLRQWYVLQLPADDSRLCPDTWQ